MRPIFRVASAGVAIAGVAFALALAACGKGDAGKSAAKVGATGNDDLELTGKKPPDCKLSAKFAAACDTGSAEACSAAARCFLDGRDGHPLDYAKSIGFAQKACNANEGEGCSLLGLHYQDGLGTEWAPAEAVKVYEKSCTLGTGVGCFNLASMYLGGHGIDSDPIKGERYTDLAKTHWEAACMGEKPTWCTNYAFSLLRDDKSPATRAKVLTLNERACEFGTPVGCTEAARARMELGQLSAEEFVTEISKLCVNGEFSACAVGGAMLLLGKDDIEADPPTAVAMIRRGCELGDKMSCEMMAIEHARGEFVPQDFDETTRYLELACDRALAHACFMLSEENRAQRVADKTAAFAQRACQMGEGEACAGLAAMHLAGAGIPKDESAGVKWAHAACQMGFPPGCGMLLERDLALPVPDELKLRIYAQACEGGDARSCERGRALESELAPPSVIAPQ